MTTEQSGPPQQGPGQGPGQGRPPQRGRGRREGGKRYAPRRKVCTFCVDKISFIDYKDVPRLRRHLSERGKIEPRRKTGTCAKHQRALAVALKRARHVALLPYTAEHIRLSGMVMRSPDDRRRDGDRGPRPPVAAPVEAGAPATAAGDGATPAQAPGEVGVVDEVPGTPAEPVASSDVIEAVERAPADSPAPTAAIPDDEAARPVAAE